MRHGAIAAAENEKLAPGVDQQSNLIKIMMRIMIMITMMTIMIMITMMTIMINKAI